MSNAKDYLTYLIGRIGEAADTQSENIDSAAALIAGSYCAGKNVFVFGTGHSHMVAEEMYIRAGGLAFIKGILPAELMLHQMPLKSTLLERLEGYAAAMIQLYHISSGDTIIIISNSGRNSVPVELAQGSKEHGANVIAITSLKHSKKVQSRNSGGKRLFEIADVVLDNQAAYGDAEYYVDGCDVPTGPISDAVGIALAQAVVVSVTEKLVQNGVEPPLFRSSNADGADDYNDKLFNKYFG